MQYTDTFKARMVRKLLGPNAVKARALEKEVGVPQSTLSRWLRETATFRAMEKNGKAPPPTPSERPAKRPQDFTAEEKLRAVVETNGLEGEALGEFLRRNGIHREQLETWRQTARLALQPSRPRVKDESKRIKELERELRRKEKALAETAALLVLRKKVNALWGDADDDTEERNGS